MSDASNDPEPDVVVVCEHNNAKRRRVTPSTSPEAFDHPSDDDKADCLMHNGFLENVFSSRAPLLGEPRECRELQACLDAVTRDLVATKTSNPELQPWLIHTHLASFRSFPMAVRELELPRHTYTEVVFNVGVCAKAPAFSVVVALLLEGGAPVDASVAAVVTPHHCAPVLCSLTRPAYLAYLSQRARATFSEVVGSANTAARKFWNTPTELCEFFGLDAQNPEKLKTFVRALLEAAVLIPHHIPHETSSAAVLYPTVSHAHDSRPPRGQRPLKVLCAEEHVFPCPITRDAFLASHADLNECLRRQLCDRARLRVERSVSVDRASQVHTMQLDADERVLRLSMLRTAGNTRQIISFEIDFDDLQQLVAFM